MLEAISISTKNEVNLQLGTEMLVSLKLGMLHRGLEVEFRTDRTGVCKCPYHLYRSDA